MTREDINALTNLAIVLKETATAINEALGKIEMKCKSDPVDFAVLNPSQRLYKLIRIYFGISFHGEGRQTVSKAEFSSVWLATQQGYGFKTKRGFGKVMYAELEAIMDRPDVKKYFGRAE